MSKKPQPKSKPQRETSANVLKHALLRRFDRRIGASGELDFPCIPAMIEPYMAKLNSQWTLLGRPFSEEENAKLRKALLGELERGYKESIYSRVTVRFKTYTPPHPGIEYFISPRVLSLQEVYINWGKGQDTPLFGRHPDAKVVKVASELGEPESVPIVDIGAGVGRNALALGRRGYPTTAVEPVATMADIVIATAAEEKIPVDVVQADVLAPDFAIPGKRYKLAVLSEVTSHFRNLDDMRTLFVRLAELLAPGGIALFSAFLTSDGYKPDDMVRQAAQALWCTVFTRNELSLITQEMPFEKVSDESVCEFEKEHTPEEDWPPTNWFEAWTQGGDVFALPPGKSPIELRWLAYRRK